MTLSESWSPTSKSVTCPSSASAEGLFLLVTSTEVLQVFLFQVLLFVIMLIIFTKSRVGLVHTFVVLDLKVLNLEYIEPVSFSYHI